MGLETLFPCFTGLEERCDHTGRARALRKADNAVEGTFTLEDFGDCFHPFVKVQVFDRFIGTVVRTTPPAKGGGRVGGTVEFLRVVAGDVGRSELERSSRPGEGGSGEGFYEVFFQGARFAAE